MSIEHPKLLHRFTVRFSGTVDPAVSAIADLHLRHLSAQVTAVTLPELNLAVANTSGRRPVPGYVNVHTRGDLRITLWNGVENQALLALRFIQQHVADLEVRVSLLGQSEEPVEAFIFGRVGLSAVEHARLAYDEPSTAATVTMVATPTYTEHLLA